MKHTPKRNKKKRYWKHTPDLPLSNEPICDKICKLNNLRMVEKRGRQRKKLKKWRYIKIYRCPMNKTWAIFIEDRGAKWISTKRKILKKLFVTITSIKCLRLDFNLNFNDMGNALWIGGILILIDKSGEFASQNVRVYINIVKTYLK